MSGLEPFLLVAASGFLNELHSRGYNIVSSGGFANRNIRGGSRRSQHAYGNAIDINAVVNALGSREHDLPDNVAEIAARHGLTWGGNFTGRADPMHFEFHADHGVPMRSLEEFSRLAAAGRAPAGDGRAALDGGDGGGATAADRPGVIPEGTSDYTSWLAGEFAADAAARAAPRAPGAMRLRSPEWAEAMLQDRGDRRARLPRPRRAGRVVKCSLRPPASPTIGKGRNPWRLRNACKSRSKAANSTRTTPATSCAGLTS